MQNTEWLTSSWNNSLCNVTIQDRTIWRGLKIKGYIFSKIMLAKEMHSRGTIKTACMTLVQINHNKNGLPTYEPSDLFVSHQTPWLPLPTVMKTLQHTTQFCDSWMPLLREWNGGRYGRVGDTLQNTELSLYRCVGTEGMIIRIGRDNIIWGIHFKSDGYMVDNITVLKTFAQYTPRISV